MGSEEAEGGLPLIFLQPADEADLEAVLSSPAPVGKEIIGRAARARTNLIRFFRNDSGLLQL